MWQIPLSKLSLLPPLLRSLGFHNSFACQDQSRCVVENMRLSQVPLAGLVTSTVAAVATTNLFVSSYAGTVSTLLLSPAAIGGYSLKTVSVNTVAQTSPSWLTKDELNGIIYSTDEGFFGPNGSVSAYSASDSGDLTLLGRTITVGGPVSSVVYNGGKGLALAHYGGSSVTSWSIRANGTLDPLQALTFKLTAPGTNPARQDAPHPHQVVVDPTDSFIVVPDLGADLVRVFTIDKTNNLLTEVTPFATPAGSGPRHGAFLTADCGNTYFFLIAELSNTITSYKVTYGEASLGFEEVFVSGTYGPTATPVGAAAAEAIISPDGKFLLTSSRNATLFEIDNFDSTNSTKIPSDTLQSWAIDDATGNLSFVQLAPAGGRFPRQFSLNKAGTLAAVGLQSDSRVVIVQRDVGTGKFGDFVASIDVGGEITSVIWDE
ncbi:3-carboxymuconate cyclase-like protein-like protein [Leptodontidium sp. MPI-SDFR-AT-0119]|nr:3-carboxymuconate cyclase-like protein-like protein [Leptodontidium sp. MPI-SDFR-AT-0119]